MAEETTTGVRPFRVGDIVRHTPTGQLGRVTALGPGPLLTIDLPGEAPGRRSRPVRRGAVRHATADELVVWSMGEGEG